MEDLNNQMSERLNSQQHQEGAITQILAARRKSSVWSWVFGAAGGALVVGAVWGVTAYAGGPVIAKVGNTSIHQSTFDTKLETLSGAQALQGMIADQLIQDAAKKYNLSASKNETDTALSNLEAQYNISGPEQLNAFIAQNGVTMTELQNILKNQVLEQKLAVRDVKVTDQEIQDFYKANKTQFIKPGSSSPEPLASVRSQIVKSIQQSKAVQPSQLLANLAKAESIQILDSKYASVKGQIENPQPSTQTGQ